MPSCTHGDVGALLVHGGDDGAGVCVEMVLALGVADAADGAPHHALDINIRIAGSNLTANDGKSGAYEGFTCDMGRRVLSEKIIEDGVGNLVGHFVGVAL